MKDPAQEIGQLREQLRHHEHLYYVLDSPEIADSEYDAMMRRLQTLEADHPALVSADSPTRRVGGKPREGFVKVTHSSPLLSLDNALNETELREFDRRIPDIEAALRPGDLLVITADHGCDPTYRGSDHTREYAPLLVYGKKSRPGVNLGTRDSLADIGQTIAANFRVKLSAGESFLDRIYKM